MDTGFESMCPQAFGTKQLNGVDGQHTEWSAAICNDFFAGRKLGDSALQFLERDGKRPGNVCRPIFFQRPDVDH